jgi:hypothetical protein
MEQLSGTQRDGLLGLGDALEDHLLVGLKDRRSIESRPGEPPVGYSWCCRGNSCHISTPAGQNAGKSISCKYSKPPREFWPSIQLRELWRPPNIRETLYCWWSREQARISWNFTVFPAFGKHFTTSPAHPRVRSAQPSKRPQLCSNRRLLISQMHTFAPIVKRLAIPQIDAPDASRMRCSPSRGQSRGTAIAFAFSVNRAKNIYSERRESCPRRAPDRAREKEQSRARVSLHQLSSAIIIMSRDW